jgi:acetolactate synthase-1/2/3 large subunit
MMDLGDPGLDCGWQAAWALRRARAETLEAFGELLVQSFSRPDPFLIELVI